MKQARIKYCETLPPFGEGYAVEINKCDGWELESYYALQHCIIDTETDERNFIHFSILNKIKQLTTFGYTIQIM